MADEKKERVALADEDLDKVAGGKIIGSNSKNAKKKYVCSNYPTCDGMLESQVNLEGWLCPKCKKSTLKLKENQGGPTTL